MERLRNYTTNRLQKYSAPQRYAIVAGIVILTGAAIMLIATLFSNTIGKHLLKTQTASSQFQATVTINDQGFVPSTLYVKAGTKIIWRNAGTDNHQLATDRSQPANVPRAIESGTALPPEFTYARDFSAIGRYLYFDPLHPQLKGAVIVE